MNGKQDRQQGQGRETAGRETAGRETAGREIDLQRCVDGELSDSARRELLKSLDARPEGWRDLALMYVENQVIGSEIRGTATEEHAATPPTAATAKTTRGNVAPSRRWPMGVAWPMVAASLLVGAMLPLIRQMIVPAERNVAVNDPTVVEPADAAMTLASSDAGNTAPVSAAPTSGQGQEGGERRAPGGSAVPKMHLNLVSDGGSEMQIPVFGPESFPQAWPQGESLMPEQFRRQLEEQGMKLDRYPQMIVYPLEDGSRILIPAESVRLRYQVQ